MGLWQILKGEQPGLLKSVLHYRNAGQFGEYLIDYALQSNGIEGSPCLLSTYTYCMDAMLLSINWQLKRNCSLLRRG